MRGCEGRLRASMCSKLLSIGRRRRRLFLRSQKGGSNLIGPARCVRIGGARGIRVGDSYRQGNLNDKIRALSRDYKDADLGNECFGIGIHSLE